MVRPVYNPYMGIARALIAQRCRSGEPITARFLGTVWPAIVGSELTNRTRPIRLTEEKIVIEVPSELWRRELSKQRKMMLDQINHFLPRDLKELTFIISSPDRFPRASASAPPPPAPKGEVPEVEEEILEEMVDLELRDLLKRVRRLHKGRHEDG